jgi:hypothetical protein
MAATWWSTRAWGSSCWWRTTSSRRLWGGRCRARRCPCAWHLVAQLRG